MLEKQNLLDTTESAQLLSFFVGEYECAFELEFLKEIVWMVEITKVPRAPHFIEGIINARGRVISIGNLRRLFSMPVRDFNEDTQIIISEAAGKEIGFIVDSSREILYISRGDILPPDETLPLSEFLKGVAQFEGRLVLLLDIMKILTYKGAALTGAGHKKERKDRTADPEESTGMSGRKTESREFTKLLRTRTVALAQRADGGREEQKELLVVRLGSEWYGVSIQDVREVLEPVKPVFIPYAPDHVDGVINVRGEVFALINIKQFLEFPASPQESMKYLVMDIPGMKISIPVDEVEGITAIREKDIIPPLLSIKKVPVDYLEGEAKWDNRLLGIFDMNKIAKAIKNSGN